LKIIQKLRAYNLPLEIIKQLKDSLNSNSTVEENTKIDDDFAEFLLSKDASLTRKEIKTYLSREHTSRFNRHKIRPQNSDR
jgi:DNA-binding transcriptional MerR regulator